MRFAGAVIDTVLFVAIIVLLARFILDWVQMFARQWRPKGAVAVLCEALYSLTDPPLRAVRKFIPSVRLGGAAIDFSPMILLIGIYLLRAVNHQIFY
ncbi:MAG: YggT family protein [Actinomycetota bacterium]|nr:YggT family protein [Actinomycetota bacterium]